MKVTVTDGKLIYKKLMKNCEIPVSDLAWAYLQKEDVSASLCCARMNMEIIRVVVQDKNGSQMVFPYEDRKEAQELLSDLEKAAPGIAVGYTEENKAKFAHLG